MGTPQQPTIGVTMDMIYMAHTPGSASMMVHGMEMLQNAVRQSQV